MTTTPGRTSAVLHFSKMHGAGNDFVVLDLRHAPEPAPAVCRALADRHTGVGCDLILGVKAPRTAAAVASYVIWTAEGAPSQQCGNGARCVAAWVLRAGLARGPRFALDSPLATHAVDVLDESSFRIAMGVPRFGPEQIPVSGFDGERDLYEADLGGGLRPRFAAVSMGNPHAVIEVDDVDAAPVARVGLALQNSRVLPPTVNVGFAEVAARDRVRLRVYEYGAGETLACGSGACAAAAVLIRRGRVDRLVHVAQSGGELHIGWPDAAAEISLTGPAAFTYEGQFPHGYLQQHP
ncbi:diaminopimelate epimerase [Actinomadura roseirufa]|uniref:diaminopimelate epimerase n=1 Tax=Actinomadura roseirufa TaxID=2094049 RepID=UPI001A954CA9|nr:diaminopimelate epimerase [Actinomadura roseirufa]